MAKKHSDEKENEYVPSYNKEFQNEPLYIDERDVQGMPLLQNYIRKTI